MEPTPTVWGLVGGGAGLKGRAEVEEVRRGVVERFVEEASLRIARESRFFRASVLSSDHTHLL
jgi:hypothetical protein